MGRLKVMNAGRKKNLMLAGGGVTLFIIIVAVVAVSFFDINSYKSKIETAASTATGLDVGIKGEMGISFFPFGLSAKDVHVTGKGEQILVLERLRIGAELLPLARGQFTMTSCELVSPSVTIVKETDGKYNFEKVDKKSPQGAPGRSFGLNELKLSKGSLVYLDKKTGERTELKEIDLAVRDLSLTGSSGDILSNLSFTGSIDCRELIKKDLKINNIKGSVKAEQGIFVFDPLTMEIFGAQGEGGITLDRTKADREYKLNLKAHKLDFEKLTASFGVNRLIGGKGDLTVSLTAKEKGGRIDLSSMDGTLSLRGDNLTTYTVDLDKVLSSYETSQTFNLADIGVYFIAGPLGAVALKTYRYGDLYYQSRGGRGAVTRFVSHWKIGNGEADAMDCALSTRNNRVALKGKLNFVRKRYDNVIVALLDDQGCPKFKQSISGSFGSPQVGAVSAVESLAGPILNVYRQAKRFIQNGRCEIFYRGSVQQPH
jgi:uncharacterized protein involved in outer membrane biogenesis